MFKLSMIRFNEMAADASGVLPYFESHETGTYETLGQALYWATQTAIGEREYEWARLTGPGARLFGQIFGDTANTRVIHWASV